MGCITYSNLCPASGDPENVLLQKILLSLNAGGGGSGGGVTGLSVNGGAFQTGQVSIVTGGGGGVSSVNGDAGPAVLLDSGEVPEGSNLYFTDARAIASPLTGFVSGAGTITAASTILQAAQILDARTSTGGSGPFVLKAGDTMTGALLLTTPANVSPLQVTSYSATGANTPSALFVAGSWNTTGAPIALNLDIADTASNAAALLFDFKLSGMTVFNLRKDGRLSLTGRITALTTSTVGHRLFTNTANTTGIPTVLSIGHGLTAGVGADGIGAVIDWFAPSSTTAETLMSRVITQFTTANHATRTSAQLFQGYTGGVFGTTMTLTDGQVQSSNGTAALPAFSNRNDPNTGIYFSAADTIAFSTGGVARATLSGGVFDLLGGQILAGNGTISVVDTTDLLFNGGDFEFYSPSTGIIVFGDGSLGAPTAVNFGGTTSSFSSLRFVGTEIQFKLADNSAFSDIKADQVYAGNGSAAAPSFSFTSAPALGMYFIDASTIGFSSAGNAIVQIGGQSAINAVNTDLFGVTIQHSIVSTVGIPLPALRILSDWDTTDIGQAIFVDVIDIASDAASTLIDLQVNSSPRFSVGKFGVMQLAGGTALGADPTSAVAQWATSGEWQYRTSAASEGSGQTNRVHNRAALAVGTGTAYTFTTGMAHVVFGTTNPDVVLPTAGTYLITGTQDVTGGPGASGDQMTFQFYNVTDSAVFGSIITNNTIELSGTEQVTYSTVVTVTATKTVGFAARNATAARGTVNILGTNIQFVRLY